MTAYNYHHALVIRPDDVWLAILTQFNFFLNGFGRAELLRAAFVSHSGQQSLTVEGGFGDLEGLVVEMSDLIEKNVLDPSLRSWAIPNFSTTTPTDKAVGAMVLMATLRAYFEYVYDATCCGIPRVTLLGTRNDWKDILGRAEKLKEYGIETTAWYHLLVPVLSRFVDAFDDPNGQRNIDFWKQVAHWEPQGSGPDYYSGWITAFCAFSDKGAWVGPPLNTVSSWLSTEDPGSLTAARFWKVYGQQLYVMSELILDDTRYHQIDCDRVPPSYSAVEVRLISETEDTQCEAIAGVVGTMVFSSGDVELSASGEDDTVRPVVGWWVYEKK
ncbi:hypothetical protein R3P38DRAFT_2961149 [Favolaschia claudopus]|uniref:Uncharacterized protein n=1 Tax=Favolaschia claudopus TaxID=2862362 RepID=A0AAW0B8Z0_9AGAR